MGSLGYEDCGGFIWRVDSAVAVAILVEQGYEVTGVFLECWNEPGCRTDQDRQDALGVALKLKIPFRVLDFKKEYKQKVLEWFYREYKAGRTPNPDVICNREIKFGMFWSGPGMRRVNLNLIMWQRDTMHKLDLARLGSMCPACRSYRFSDCGQVRQFIYYNQLTSRKDQTYFWHY